MSNKLIAFMYHGVVSGPSQIPPDREPGSELYDLPLAGFKEQMEYLKNQKLAVGLWGDGESQEPVPVNASAGSGEVILTFDDGEMNNFQNAFAVLRPFDFPAYFFITVNRVGGKGYMGWEELKELRDAGMQIGSHSLNHKILTVLRPKQIEEELMESKAVLEQNLKVNVDYFSVPRGFYNEKIVGIAKEAGYKKIFVSDVLPGSDTSYCIGRTAVKGDWTIKRFVLALQGQAPASEKAGEVLKNLAKNLIGPGGYDRLRTAILKAKR